ncbi:hypothetical protein [Pseudomonas folii]|uniref:Bacterial Ig-like domain-containing protein n=1 Tax=Pseudomonas folii TaxID=2762593 RepID=A0ABR7AW03_9PSED|nr:hypothetical protein [Pseudomonas folii]MBC3949089.1 hypothetical protein [Pseudomonas folii]
MVTQSQFAQPIPPPTIDSVVDSQLEFVPDGGDTNDYRFTLSGKVGFVGDAVVSIFINGAVTVRVGASDGNWSANLRVFAVGNQCFIAQSSSSPQDSEPWLINVLGWDYPVIDGAVDSSGRPIPNGGTTADTRLSLSGTVVEQTMVDILDNGLLVSRAFPDEDKKWTALVQTLTVGTHSFTARAYSNGAVSAPWLITATNP